MWLRFISKLLLFVSICLSAVACNKEFHAADTSADGSPGAPSGTPEMPSLLSRYSYRPSWNVAGVDYYVGIPSGTTLTSWENITGNGDAVLNSNFQYGTSMENKYNTIGGYGGSDFTIENCVLDGNGPALGEAAANQSTLNSAIWTGTITVKYNLFENFNQHVLEVLNPSTIVYEYNLIYNGGSGATGQHLNYLQFSNFTGTATVTVEYNTTYQPTSPVSGGQGFQFYDNGSGDIEATFAYNTMIYGSDGSGLAQVPDTAYAGVTTAQITNNYIDAGGSTAFFYPDPNVGTSDIYTGNVNMVSGAIVTASP